MIDTERDRVRVVMFGTMIAMFIVSLAIPGAFADQGLLFALAYTAIRVAHVLLFAVRAAPVPRPARRSRYQPWLASRSAVVTRSWPLSAPKGGEV